MQAIILAAGMGKRLGELTQNNTKCMVKVNGVTLIDRLMTQLSELSLKKIIIVIGYQGEKLRSYLGENYLNTKIEYIYNPIYDKTNNIYSLALAKESLQEDDSLLIESDLIFDDSLFRKIIDNPYPDITLVDKYESWMDGTMVTLDEENNIENFVSKKAFKYSDVHNYYKTVNIYKFSKEFSKHKYVPFLDAYCKALGHNEYYEQVLKVISRLDDTHLKALPLNGEKWYEIDDIQDLDIAETIFAPKEDLLIKYQSRYGGYWRFPSLLDFCYLVNPYFPPKKMKEEFNCKPENIICCVAPSIRKCHFEVEEDVKDMFYNEFKDLEEINEIIEKSEKENKWNIDTVLINRVILKEQGLKDENIIDCGICSVCNSNIIHSFRVEKEGYGLATALIELK